MLPQTYTGVLHGDRIEWTGTPPPPTAEPVRVQVTVVPEPSPAEEERRQRMVVALRELAAHHDPDLFGDPVAWQREVRRDRPLPGRDD